MGKEQELLDASRLGNVAVVEKILSNRKRSGPLAPLASFRRTANPNCQDPNGYTPLHHAALNGNKEIVEILLRHEASANILDSKGCSPLHLAAWNGHTYICETLLSQGPSLAKVNEQSHDGETSLHSAAQYGHTGAVAVLLQYYADPCLRNIRSETPLDLACQYGRLDSVEILVKRHPALLCDNVDSHCPLHLASRNGHRQVVQVLIDHGFDINIRTENGSALHEASLFGKPDVVRLLLDNDIDLEITDSCNRTALEVISEHKSHITQEIGRIITAHIEATEACPKRSSFGSTSTTSSSRHSAGGDVLYDDVPPPKPVRRAASRSSSLTTADRSVSRSSTLSQSDGSSGYAVYARPIKPERKDRPKHWEQRETDSVLSQSSSIYDSPLLLARPLSAPIIDDHEPIYDIPQPRNSLQQPRKASVETLKSDCTLDGCCQASARASPIPVTMNTSRGSPMGSPRHSPRCTGLSISPDTPKKPPRRKKDSRASMRLSDDNRLYDDITGSKESLNRSLCEDKLNRSYEDSRSFEMDNKITEECSRKERSTKELRSPDREEKKDSEKADNEKEVSQEKEGS